MTHVVVIGAGMIGICAADQLARSGVEVTLIDSEPPGTGTSGTSLAWLNANKKLPRSYHGFSVRAMREWQQLACSFQRPPWHVPTGCLTWATSDAQQAELVERVARLREWGYSAEHVTLKQGADLEPQLRIPQDAAVAFFSSEGFVHTHQAANALVARAQDAGAAVVTGMPAVLEQRGSRITTVRLSDGTRIRGDVYLCCAGWRTPHLLEPLGVTAPMIRGDAPGSTAPCLVTRIQIPHAPITRVIQTPHLKLRPTMPGGLHLEASDINRLVNTQTEQTQLDRHGSELTQRAERVIPTLKALASIDTRLCVRPLPLDGKPIADWVPTLGNAYVIVTHSGITLGPMIARLAVAEILDGHRGDGLAPYRITRFDASA